MDDLDNSKPSEDVPVNAPADGALPEIIPAAAGVTLDTLTEGLAGEAASLNRDGTPRKKPGRKPGQKNGTGAAALASAGDTPAATPSAPQTPATKKAVRLASDQTARAILNTTVGALAELIGPEWDFQNQTEADGMRLALGAYIEAKGGGEMSPELAMLLVSSGYALPRLRHENTRDKLARFFGGAWKAIKGVFTR